MEPKNTASDIRSEGQKNRDNEETKELKKAIAEAISRIGEFEKVMQYLKEVLVDLRAQRDYVVRDVIIELESLFRKTDLNKHPQLLYQYNNLVEMNCSVRHCDEESLFALNEKKMAIERLRMDLNTLRTFIGLEFLPLQNKQKQDGNN